MDKPTISIVRFTIFNITKLERNGISGYIYKNITIASIANNKVESSSLEQFITNYYTNNKNLC